MSAAEPPVDMYFEDFHVGQVFLSEPHQVTEDDLMAFAEVSGDHSALHTNAAYAATTQFGQRLVHGPYGLVRFFGSLHDSGIVDKTAIALLDTNWTYHAPVFVEDELSYECTITRCRRTRSGDKGVVSRHVAVRRGDGVIAQSGTTSILVTAREDLAVAADPFGLDFCGRRWATELMRRLNASAEFSASCGSFDGTIGLRARETETHLRIYRGKVIEASPRTPLGATFTVQATELTWLQHVSSKRNEFMERALRDEFSVSGNSYEYLRLTKALMLIWDAARAMAQETIR